ncbi:MAG: hypothetical protein PV340_04670 [Wolbachia sp.]|nr:hypothetical protein [Wolbachia sp.]
MLGPLGCIVVRALALTDNKSKGKFSEAGEDLASRTGNILESL